MALLFPDDTWYQHSLDEPPLRHASLSTRSMVKDRYLEILIATTKENTLQVLVITTYL